MTYMGDERVFHAAYGTPKTLFQIADMLCSQVGVPDHPIEEVSDGISPREPLSASLADTYTSQKFGIVFRHSLETILQDVINRLTYDSIS